ncbi:MAG: DotI/IcmL/TraM family protein [Pseudomonadota bacterium]|nr:hypothetical protein [Pseudomonadota bacterium]QKK05090.1 MAG: DotI/IcmL/TraM family protein [Pseudomonadota bacterium]
MTVNSHLVSGLSLGILTGFLTTLYCMHMLLAPHIAAKQEKGLEARQYFSYMPDGSLYEMTPLSRPVINETALLAWMTAAMEETMSFTAEDYQQELQHSTRYFTRDGWESVAKLLQEMELLKPLEQGTAYTIAHSTTPVIIGQNIIDGRLHWVIETDLEIFFYTENKQRIKLKHLPLRITIERSPALENTNGIAMSRWENRESMKQK